MFDWLLRLFRSSRETRETEQSVSAEISEQASRLPPRSTRKKKDLRVVTVGVDFGTSSTKIIVSGIVPGKHHLLYPAEKADGYPEFALPSSVQISEGRAYFGSSAEKHRPSSVTFHSFKICLACQHALTRCRGCDHQIRPEQPAHFEVSIADKHLAISAEHLATWYLAYVFAMARGEVDRRWGESFEFKYLFNVGAPIDQQNKNVGARVFNNVAYLGEKLSKSVWDGRPLSVLMDTYRTASAAFSQVPGDEERETFIQPETAAGLMSFVTSPTAQGGLYGIVDVGAGTTDVSFFRLSDLRRDHPRLMSFYEAKTEVVGADDIDRAISKVVLPRLSGDGSNSIADEELLASCKRGKEGLGEKPSLSVTTHSGTIEIPRQQIEEAINPLTSRMVSTYVTTVRLAYEKEKRVSKWHDFTLFLLGGGTRFKPVADRILRSRPSEYNREIRPVRILAPPDLDAAASAKSNFDLLAVAYGLSFPPVDYPEILNPSEVEPLRINRRRDERPDRDDLYPK